MIVSKIRLWLWVASAAMAASGVVLLGWLGTGPLGAPTDDGQTSQASRTVSANKDGSPNGNTADAALPSLASLQPLWALDLRRPLYDPPPALVEAPKPPQLKLKLVGTIVEPGHSKAILTTADGKTELKGVGEKLANAEILSIGADSVTIRYDGGQIVLKPATDKSPK